VAKRRCVPNQLLGAPPWQKLRGLVLEYCDRARRTYREELAGYEPGSKSWAILSGAITYINEIDPILRSAMSWEAAWSEASDACGGVPFFGSETSRWQYLGRHSMMCTVVLSLQTGRVRELPPSLVGTAA
jgi:hypothetical protein